MHAVVMLEAKVELTQHGVLRGKQDEKSTSIRMRECRRMRDEGEGVARPELRIWRPAGPRKGPCFLAVAVGR